MYGSKRFTKERKGSVNSCREAVNNWKKRRFSKETDGTAPANEQGKDDAVDTVEREEIEKEQGDVEENLQFEELRNVEFEFDPIEYGNYDGRPEEDVEFQERSNGDEQHETKKRAMDSIDVIRWIALFFLHNNTSKEMKRDIFTIANFLKKMPMITLQDVEKVLESYQDTDTRTYTFCRNCGSVLTKTRKCPSNTCFLRGRKQIGKAQCKRMITYSIKSQLQNLLKNGCIAPPNLKVGMLCTISFKREVQPISMTKIINTKRFQEIRHDLNLKDPSRYSLLATVAFDGFRKSGLFRGEFWPVFISLHDIGEGKFEEFRPECVILAGAIISTKCLKMDDFRALFARLQLDLDAITQDPIEYFFEGNKKFVDIRLVSATIDMDASRKAFGIPKWNTYGGCGRCDIFGKRVDRTLCWIPSENEEITEYGTDFAPEDMISSSQSKVPGLLLRKDELREFTNCLLHVKTVTSRYTKIFDPASISLRTGRESDELFFILAPLVVVSVRRLETLPQLVLLGNWIIARKLMDQNIKNSDIETLKTLANAFRKVLEQRFPKIFSMKMHQIINHCIPNLAHFGSPFTTSASTFERLNEVMGRHLNAYCTSSFTKMCNRFSQIQPALSMLQKSIREVDFTIELPRTVKSLSEQSAVSDCKPGDADVPANEIPEAYRNWISTQGAPDGNGWKKLSVNGKTFIGRRYNESDGTQRSCIQYKKDGVMNYGHFELVYVDENGRRAALISKFNVSNPFQSLSASVSAKFPRTFLDSAFRCVSSMNNYFLEVQKVQLDSVLCDNILSHCCTVTYNGKNYVSLMI